jgi:anaerobic dimethyl sulfoxide reductase subunit B (iron-sulfur subunit)
MMEKLGFYFNGDYCVGCRACQIACKEKNNLQLGIFFRRVRDYETGAFPHPGYYHQSLTCNHCSKPACVITCPSGAMHIAGNGTIQNDSEICIGCKNCVNACPYDIPQYLEDKEIVIKCNMCVDLTVKGENPVCVDACPQFALEWGGMEELKARHPDAVTDLPTLPDSSKTQPSTIITPRLCALDPEFRFKPI